MLVGHCLAGITIAGRRAGRRIASGGSSSLSTSNRGLAGSRINDLMKHRAVTRLARGADFEVMFCNDLDDETAAWLLSHLGPEPPGPMDEPIAAVALPASLESTYILLERDEALLPEFQRSQARTAGVREVVPFDAGHSAFASRPGELAALLLRYA